MRIWCATQRRCSIVATAATAASEKAGAGPLRWPAASRRGTGVADHPHHVIDHARRLPVREPERIAAALKDGVRATVGEADPITALDTVILSATADIDAFDNGLSTTGHLLVQTGLLSQGADRGKLVKQLEQAKVLGSLKEQTSSWYTLERSLRPKATYLPGVSNLKALGSQRTSPLRPWAGPAPATSSIPIKAEP